MAKPILLYNLLRMCRTIKISYSVIIDAIYCMYVVCLCTIGFYEDHEQNTFGIKRKGIYRPLSDFCFTFQMKVLSEKSVSTGYLVSVKQETLSGNQTEAERLTTYKLGVCWPMCQQTPG